MITPTIGRKLWYWPTAQEREGFGMSKDDTQPMDASICFVHSDRRVSITFNDHRGRHFFRPDVLLLQGDETFVPVTSYVAWTPHQQDRALPVKVPKRAKVDA